MKRIIPIAIVAIAAIFAVLLWVGRGSSRGGPLVATFLGRTNNLYSLLDITNRSRHDMAFKVEVQELGPRGWGPIGYKGPNSVPGGWLGGCSNTLIKVAAPEKDARLYLTYARVPTQIEKYISWRLASLGIRSPLRPHNRTVLIYPDNSDGKP